MINQSCQFPVLSSVQCNEYLGELNQRKQLHGINAVLYPNLCGLALLFVPYSLVLLLLSSIYLFFAVCVQKPRRIFSEEN